VFGVMPGRTAETTRADLRRARAAWIKGALNRAERRASGFLTEADHAGRVVGFHALRVTFVTLLVKSGASVKAVQEPARHCDPKLTLNVYGKLGVHDLKGALDGLPRPTRAACGPERLRATGTCSDTPTVISDHHLFPHQLTRETQRMSATSRSGDAVPATLAGERKPLRMTKVSDRTPARATSCNEGATVAQSAEQRFCN
jgi:hypothetical protein